MKFQPIFVLAFGATLVTGATAQVQKFKVGSPDGMKVTQVMTVESDAEFENFTGTTLKITGEGQFDPTKKSGGGKLVVDLSGIDTGMPLRNEHMKSAGWLDVSKYPTAVFETLSAKHKSGETYAVTGNLTLHGVTKKIVTDVTIRFIPESETSKRAGFKGNVVNLKTAFKVNIGDFGIKNQAPGKVADTVNIRINVFGYTG